MQTTLLGTQGLKVSAIGLGCMGMSDFYGHHDDQTNRQTLAKALELGVGFWDTSDIYGPHTNEQLLGQFFKTNPGTREKVTLATKFGVIRDNQGNFSGVNGHPDYVRKACEASLQRLGVEYIDLYYQHRIDPNVAIEETVGAMAELVKAGKVKYLGLSEAGAQTLRRAHSVHPISALQSEYSLWSRDIEAEILPTCKDLGIGLVAYSPLGRGFLSGKIAQRSALEQGDWRLGNPRFSQANMPSNLSLVHKLEAIAEEKHCSAAQLALAWILHSEQNVVPIPGTRQVNRLVENAESTTIRLSPQEQRLLTDIFSPELIRGNRYPEQAMLLLNQ